MSYQSYLTIVDNQISLWPWCSIWQNFQLRKQLKKTTLHAYREVQLYAVRFPRSKAVSSVPLCKIHANVIPNRESTVTMGEKKHSFKNFTKNIQFTSYSNRQIWYYSSYEKKFAMKKFLYYSISSGAHFYREQLCVFNSIYT